MLAKQMWRLLQYPDSLLARVLRGRYYKYSTPLWSTSEDNPSYGWRNIIAAKPLLSLRIRQKIHSGLNTRVWQDLWILSVPSRPMRARIPVVHPLTIVSDLISKGTLDWNVDIMGEFVSRENIPLIKSLPASQTFHMDAFCWQYTKIGFYTVKPEYWVARNILFPHGDLGCTEPSTSALRVHAWKVDAPQKICHLIWQILSGYLAVTKNLVHRGMRCNNHCPRCGVPYEIPNHAIFECPPAAQTWALATTSSPPGVFPTRGLFTNLDYLF